MYNRLYIFFTLIMHTAGMDKMVVNHLEKLFVTNDAATILKELEVNIVVCTVCRHRMLAEQLK